MFWVQLWEGGAVPLAWSRPGALITARLVSLSLLPPVPAASAPQ